MRHPALLISPLALLLAVPASAADPLRPMPRGPDFDGDGHDDLAIGGSMATAGGSASVLWGGGLGLHVDLESTTVIAPGETLDLFGGGFAWGDFNGDCFDDLAVAETGADLVGAASAGAVHVFLGGPTGLDVAGAVVLHRDAVGVVDEAAEGDLFGSKLAAGDFDDDHFDDLAVGVPYDDVDDLEDVGSIHVFHGGPEGLAPDRRLENYVLSHATRSMDGDATSGSFGDRLVTGDFDCDGHDDLVTTDHLGGELGAHVIYGSPDGLSPTAGAGDRILTFAELGLPPGWGTAFGAGNFDGLLVGDPEGDYISRACLDLVVGAPDYSPPGAFVVVYGRPYDEPEPGLQIATMPPHVFEWSDLPSYGVPPVHADFLGSSFTSGRFDDDAIDDLAVSYDGGVFLLAGAPDGLTNVGAIEVPAQAPNDDSPPSLGYGDYDGDGIGDFAGAIRWDDPADEGHVEVVMMKDTADFEIEWVLAWTEDDFPGQTASPGETWGGAVTKARSTYEFSGFCD
jgi:hypothetical protein